MNIRHILAIAGIYLLSPCPTMAQNPPKDTGIKSSSKYMKVIETFSQRTLPGVRGMKPVTDYHFIMLWQNKLAPSPVFWRGDNGWLSCNVAKVHKNKMPKAKREMQDPDYISAGNGPIKKGDTIEIMPIRGGKFPIPAEIPVEAKNTLFFKTAKSNWLSFPLKKISSKPDIILP